MTEFFLIAVLVVAALTTLSPLAILFNDYRRFPSYGIELAARIMLIVGCAICVGATIIFSLLMLIS